MKLKIFLLILLTTSMLFAQGRRGGGRQLTWDESLNLTTEQMQQITALRETMQPAMMGIRQNTRTLELELRQLNRSDAPDAARIAELEASIAELETTIDQIMNSHRAQIRSLLTEDQQLIFDQRNFGSGDRKGNRRDGRTGGNPGGRRGNRAGNGRW
ncbi:MAG: Spy/CpxP family protein refolding chaperone [Candidatus Marinimicrobia bacterium]|nr:Spy/CpxP family protein refolding chaperone [Candidatus Neomarinimicrobiota bacterium]